MRNYIKTSEAQSDDSDYQPSENLQNGIRDSGKEHEHAQQSGNHVQSGNEHRELSSDASSGTRFVNFTYLMTKSHLKTKLWQNHS